jgi:butyrate kinase
MKRPQKDSYKLNLKWERTINHDIKFTESYKQIIGQYEFRKKNILEILHKEGIHGAGVRV